MRTVRFAISSLLLGSTASLCAQSGHTHLQKLDLGITYIGQRSLEVNNSQRFWLQGGSLELGIDAWRGWGVAADVTGTHTSSIGTSGPSLSLVTTTFGPRYRWHGGHRFSVYGQGLLGEANGFRSLFPTERGAINSANSLALQVGGGVDLKLSKTLAIRALDAGWLRTQLPNSTNDRQNSLRLGAGVVLCFGH